MSPHLGRKRDVTNGYHNANVTHSSFESAPSSFERPAESDDDATPGSRIRDAIARLDAIAAEHGDAARLAFDRVADSLPQPLSKAAWPIVQAANDDVCHCPDCEGRGDAGEGDA